MDGLPRRRVSQSRRKILFRLYQHLNDEDSSDQRQEAGRLRRAALTLAANSVGEKGLTI